MSLIPSPALPDLDRPEVLYDFFEQAVRRWPQAPALDIPPTAVRGRLTLTYAELWRQCEHLAGALTEAGAGAAGQIIALLLPRTTAWLYAAQLATLRAGRAFVCIDPSFPDQQVLHILQDSGADVVATDDAGAARARRLGYHGALLVLTGQTMQEPQQPLPPLALPPVPGPDALAYVIYTSGTTGRPKGVMIPHRGIVNLISSDLLEFSLGPGDRVAQGSSAAYDSSVEEIWMALASGATVVVMDDETVRLGPDLVPWLHREGITVLCPPPTLLRATGCEAPWEALPQLRLLYVGGEALPRDVADLWAPGRRLVNGYGPTECSVTCLRQDIRPGEPIGIGQPVPGTEAWVLDENLVLVPTGTQGELCIGGAGLALGYLNAPELTETKFLDHPVLGRIYRTGDLVQKEPDGTFSYHGRIDGQVKLRGYRIELEAVETWLARFPGVREAACRVQGEGVAAALAAHLVPADPERPPRVEDLVRHLGEQLPAYMVPTLFAVAEELPRGASGKVRRNDLPLLAGRTARGVAPAPPPGAEPDDATRHAISEAVRSVLALPSRPAVDEDFFTDLGGSSLHAAMLISQLRTDPATAVLTVRDVYDGRTVAGMAQLVTGGAETQQAHPPDGTAPSAVPPAPRPRTVGTARPVWATVAQAVWILLETVIGSAAGYLTVFVVVPWITDRIGLIPLILAAPAVVTSAALIASPLTVATAMALKALLIGRYRPVRTPVWSGLHLRIWIMKQVAGFIPWRTFAGTELQCWALRALGARIGARVHIHRGVNLQQGGWDLLEIGDDVTLGQDASVHLLQLTAGHLVVGPVTLADGATLDVRAGVGPYTRVGRTAWLSALSALPPGAVVPDGETWSGVPARRTGDAPIPAVPPDGGVRLSPMLHAVAMILANSLLRSMLALPGTLLAVAVVWADHLTYRSLLSIFSHPVERLPSLALLAVLMCVSLVAAVWGDALVVRALGKVRPGVISRWSLAYIRVWLKSGMVDLANTWLSGGLFWPVWLRWAGMDVGARSEVSTIIDVVPELISIGADTFLADGIYLGGPRVHRGAVTLGTTHLASGTFLGNHVVVECSQALPPDILLGVCTVADDRVVRPGTSWFGHPAFELPTREIVTVDRDLTHTPARIRVVNRLFWEWLRFAVPLVPMAALMVWLAAVAAAASTMSAVPLLLLAVPLITLGCEVALAGVVLGLKWGLLGRVKPGVHALWSCWCSRWDFLYVAWGMIAGPVLAQLEETLLLAVYLRRMGMRIGKRVVLSAGFAQVVDPDMIEIGDGATVSTMFQAHTFEDRVLKIDHVRIGAGSTMADGTVPLYGADVGEHAVVTAHSVVMKRERLLPGHHYEGVPTRRQPERGPDDAPPAGRPPAEVAVQTRHRVRHRTRRHLAHRILLTMGGGAAVSALIAGAFEAGIGVGLDAGRPGSGAARLIGALGTPAGRIAPGRLAALAEGPVARSSPPGAPHPGSGPCLPQELHLRWGASRTTAGSAARELVVTNVGRHTCSVAGVPAVSFLDAAGLPVGPRVRPDLRATPGTGTRVDPGTAGTAPTLLAPGASAHSVLTIPAPGDRPSPAGCLGTVIRDLRVSLPGSAALLLRPADASLCLLPGGGQARITPLSHR